MYIWCIFCSPVDWCDGVGVQLKTFVVLLHLSTVTILNQKTKTDSKVILMLKPVLCSSPDRCPIKIYGLIEPIFDNPKVSLDSPFKPRKAGAGDRRDLGISYKNLTLSWYCLLLILNLLLFLSRQGTGGRKERAPCTSWNPLT